MNYKKIAAFSVSLALGAVMAIPAFAENDKVTICHRTGSESNPWVIITVSESSLKNGHTADKGDFPIPDPFSGDCANPIPPDPV